MRHGVALEQFGRAHHHRTQVRADGHRHHVGFQALAKAHTRIQARGDHIDQGIVRHNFHTHIRIGLEELAHQRQQDQLGGRAAGGDAQVARRLVAKAVEVFQGVVDITEGGFDSRIQALSGLGQGHAAGGAIEQPNSQAGFQGPQRMAQGRRRQAKLDRCPAETQVVGDAQEDRQVRSGNGLHGRLYL
ncbi:hypothetical protein D3C85_771920 [compost metagenome]